MVTSTNCPVLYRYRYVEIIILSSFIPGNHDDGLLRPTPFTHISLILPSIGVRVALPLPEYFSGTFIQVIICTGLFIGDVTSS